MKRTLSALLIAATFACAVPAAAQLTIGAGDGIEAALRAHGAKRVTLRVRSGQELTGVVRSVNARVVHLGAISGREFFDAVVPVEAIDAVLIRVKP